MPFLMQVNYYLKTYLFAQKTFYFEMREVGEDNFQLMLFLLNCQNKMEEIAYFLIFSSAYVLCVLLLVCKEFQFHCLWAIVMFLFNFLLMEWSISYFILLFFKFSPKNLLLLFHHLVFHQSYYNHLLLLVRLLIILVLLE